VRYAIALLVSLMSAFGAAAQETPQRGGMLSYAVSNGEPATFDCHAALSSAIFVRVLPHYSSLLKFDLAHYPNVTGDLAKSWSVSADGLEYRFELKPNVKFHDGTDLTSKDIKATFDRIRNPPPGVNSLRASFYKDVTAIDTPDPLTVVFRLKQPNASMLTSLAMPWNCIYSAALLASDPDYPAKKVMGTGPFKFKEYIPGSVWRGERFDAYFEPGRPYLDGFNAFSFARNSVSNAIIGGQVATEFRGLDPPEVAKIVAARGDAIKVLAANQSGMLMATFNTQRPPFNDARVRRALSLAIDRWGGAPAMAKIIPNNQVGAFNSPESPYARSKEELQKLPGFSPDINASRAEARRLLAEAGQSNLKATFLNNAPNVPLGVFLIDQWRQIGVDVTHDAADGQRFFASRSSGNYDIILDSNDYIDDPSQRLAPFLSFDNNRNNTSRVNDPKFDAMFEQQQRTTDFEQRKKLVSAIEAYLVEQAYSIPLFYTRRQVPIDANVHGYVVAPQLFLGQDLSGIWISAPRH
jgi:peptide/nickel transport system substrate-binding protein